MGKVIDINGKPRASEAAYLKCKCGRPYIPVAIINDRPFIAALECSWCEIQIPVNNGYIGGSGESA